MTIGGLLAGGVAYRNASANLEKISGLKVRLERPLSEFPININDWRGEDVPIPVNVQKVAGADDFLSRMYVNERSRIQTGLYVAYTASPRTMLGHRPQVCYPASGWVHDGTENAEIITQAGRSIPCLLHRFHRPGPGNEDRYVLNYYIVNGQLTNDEKVFSGISWRTPNITGQVAKYVAQIQISSNGENSVRQAAREMSDLLLDYFRDETTAAEK